MKRFLWEMSHGQLFTNAARWKLGLDNSSNCSQCADQMETPLHAVRDCSEARAVWSYLIPPQLEQTFFSLPLQQWIEWNVVGKRMSQYLTTWPKRMATCSWLIWKWRNDWVFRDSIIPLESKLMKICSQLEEQAVWLSCRQKQAQSISKQMILIKWECPPSSMVKLNIDGASKGNPGRAECGCVIRDHEGRWLIGAAQSLGTCSAV